MEFQIWFNVGGYGGLVCCVVAAIVSALSTFLRHRGTVRGFLSVLIVYILCALLLLVNFLWLVPRFSHRQVLLFHYNITALPGYIVMFGWILPVCVLIVSLLSVKLASSRSAKQQPAPPLPSSINQDLPRHQPGVVPPFVFNEETPWGWLEYSNGNFQGQKLELKRQVVTIGRDEECDIWLDDDMASRHHAELAWDDGKVYLTDCASLNGVALNEQRIHGTVLVNTNDRLFVGAHRFIFMLAEAKEQYDPLNHHTWRSSLDLQSKVMPALYTDTSLPLVSPHTTEKVIQQWGQPVPTKLDPFAAQQQVGILSSGDLHSRGQRFRLTRPVMILGSSPGCDIVINDKALAGQYLQFTQGEDGDYVQPYVNANRIVVNGEAVDGRHALQVGDRVSVGALTLTYMRELMPQNNFNSPVTPPPFSTTKSGPVLLKLPMRPKGS